MAMILVSDVIRTRFPTLISDFDELDGFVRAYEQRFVGRFVPADDPRDPTLSIEEKMRLLLHSALARARLLVWAVVYCINGDLSPGCYLATRAHFEMTGVLAYILRDLRKWRSGALEIVALLRIWS
jgi:hypothetical protein